MRTIHTVHRDQVLLHTEYYTVEDLHIMAICEQRTTYNHGDYVYAHEGYIIIVLNILFLTPATIGTQPQYNIIVYQGMCLHVSL